MNLQQRIDNIDSEKLSAGLNNQGFALVPQLLTPAECAQLTQDYPAGNLYRKTVVMERHQYGLGEYKYFTYPLPAVVQQLRRGIYPLLAPVANGWMSMLNLPHSFPDTLDELLSYCHTEGQLKPTPLILQYGASGYNALHQDLYGKVFFPMQAVIMLSRAGTDYTGGEFILVEQRPRAQSVARALSPAQGDMLVFTTNYRPVPGARGYRRVNMRHGVSEITGGNRYSLGLIFHDAQ